MLRSAFALGAVVLVALLAAAGASAARAGGGSSIATAPTVQWGQQLFGNTANAPVDFYPEWSTEYSGGVRTDYWKLGLIAGDKVTIDWQNDPSAGLQLVVVPAGTTDDNINNVGRLVFQAVGANGHNELVFSVNRDGDYPLIVAPCRDEPCGFWGDDGSYSFLARVQHGLVLRARASAHRKRGTAVVDLYTPDGNRLPADATTVKVYVKQPGGWKRLAQARAGGHSLLAFKVPVKLRGSTVTLRVVAGGNAYRSATETLRVHVKA